MLNHSPFYINYLKGVLKMEIDVNYDRDVNKALIEEESLEGKVNVQPPEGYTGEVITSPLKAIRAKCIECSNNMLGEIKECTVTGCPLWPFRMNKNPYRQTREMTEEQKEALRDRMKKARDGKNN